MTGRRAGKVAERNEISHLSSVEHACFIMNTSRARERAITRVTFVRRVGRTVAGGLSWRFSHSR